MDDAYKELVKRLRSEEWATVEREQTRNAAADALEAVAGEVERLRGEQRLKSLIGPSENAVERIIAERDRLKAALEQIKAEAPKSSPAMDDDYGGNFDDAWSGGWDSGFNAAANIARKALGGDAS